MLRMWSGEKFLGAQQGGAGGGKETCQRQEEGDPEELQRSEGFRLRISDIQGCNKNHSNTSGSKQPSSAYKYVIWAGLSTEASSVLHAAPVWAADPRTLFPDGSFTQLAPKSGGSGWSAGAEAEEPSVFLHVILPTCLGPSQNGGSFQGKHHKREGGRQRLHVFSDLASFLLSPVNQSHQKGPASSKERL